MEPFVCESCGEEKPAPTVAPELFPDRCDDCLCRGAAAYLGQFDGRAPS